jgi:hypothetical protein
MKLQTLTTPLLAFASLGIGLWATQTVEQPATANEPHGSLKNPSVQTRESKPNHIFDETVPLLLRKTLVPLRLPAYVPFSDDKETPLYSILEVAEPMSYSIQLAWTKDCNGGNACHVGYVGGTKTVPQPSDKPEVPVSLTGGITGSFVGFDCGAHCDDASLYWTEGGYYYEISLKAGDKKALIRMANSAIQKAGASAMTSSGRVAAP